MKDRHSPRILVIVDYYQSEVLPLPVWTAHRFAALTMRHASSNFP
jgi:hypothetical protein